MVVERSLKKLPQNTLQPILPDSFNPNISALEAKARASWYQSLKQANSPISDLFVGQ